MFSGGWLRPALVTRPQLFSWARSWLGTWFQMLPLLSTVTDVAGWRTGELCALTGTSRFRGVLALDACLVRSQNSDVLFTQVHFLRYAGRAQCRICRHSRLRWIADRMLQARGHSHNERCRGAGLVYIWEAKRPGCGKRGF